MIVKVCGMRDADNIRDVEVLGVDLMGFIFYPPSPRYAEHLPSYLPECRRIGVFVDAPVEEILRFAGRWGLWGVQLHGTEPPMLCRSLRNAGLHVIKAFGVGHGLPPHLKDFDGCCDMFLFDTACKSHGGSGILFDWNILTNYTGDTPFLLSGGIGPDALPKIKEFSHPQWAGIDLNSAFELSPARKDTKLLDDFLNQLREGLHQGGETKQKL